MPNKKDPQKIKTKPANDAGWNKLDKKTSSHRPWELNLKKQTKPEDVPRSTESVVAVPINLIRPNPDQPRRIFNPTTFAALVQSISDPKVGLIEPIVIRRVEPDLYEIIAGERRWRACQSLKHKTIESIIKDVTAAQAYKISVVENINRDSLNPIEKALSFKALLEKKIFKNQTKMSAELGITRTSIVKTLRLLERLSKEAIEVYFTSSDTVTEGHLHAVMRAPLKDQKELIKRIKEETYSVQKSRDYVSSTYFNNTRSNTVAVKEKHPNWFDLEIHVRPKTTKAEIKELLNTLKITIAKLKKLEKGTETD